MQLAARAILKVPLRGAKMNLFNKKTIGQTLGLMAISSALAGNFGGRLYCYFILFSKFTF
jgi:hypothetical protein